MTLQLVRELHPLTWTFGDRIRKVRKATGLNQAEFAARIGVAVGTYGGWEAGDVEPRRGVIVAQAIEREFGDTHGATANWVLGLEDAPTDPGGAAEWAPWGSNPRPMGRRPEPYRHLAVAS